MTEKFEIDPAFRARINSREAYMAFRKEWRDLHKTIVPRNKELKGLIANGFKRGVYVGEQQCELVANKSTITMYELQVRWAKQLAREAHAQSRAA